MEIINGKKTYNILSLGAGVQSSTLAMMYEKGFLGKKPDCAIFADVGAEPKKVHEYLDWLTNQISYPVYIVKKGNIFSDFMEEKYRNGYVPFPIFTKDKNGKIGMGKRQCTSNYKIVPVYEKIREIIGLKTGERAKNILVNQIIGISYDEMERMTINQKKWITNVYPLYEMKITRRKCLEWFRENIGDNLPPRSACTFCPYHSNEEWKRMKEDDPESFAQAVIVDEFLRSPDRKRTMLNISEEEFLHRSGVPLKDVDFRSDIDKGQQVFGFLQECSGMCGL